MEEVFKKINFIFWNNNFQDIDLFYPILSVFCKKFEVFKRIFSVYNNKSMKLKKASDDYKNIFVYGLISCSFLFYYKKTNNLKFLNCALKINDLLCSIIDKIKEGDSFVQMLICYNLILESEIINEMIKSRGVEL